jgi:hypothetical protein
MVGCWKFQGEGDGGSSTCLSCVFLLCVSLARGGDSKNRSDLIN